jgi:hypothetical protein
MAKDKSLKEKNAPIVVIFIVWCLALYAVFVISPTDFWGKLQSIFKEFNAKDGLILIISPILTLILTGLISSDNKAKLVFWRYRYALPGHRAFSEVVKHDARINVKQLAQKMGSIPKGPKEQNSQWYSIYKRYSEAPMVMHSHKNFLLARDLCSISFLFALIGPWGLLLHGHRSYTVLVYASVMLAHYLLLMAVARNHGNRFVCNVLAEFMADKNP